MVLLFEVAGPFRCKPKVERVGALTRIIWGCLSVAWVPAGFNDIARTFREDEREICAGICDRFAALGRITAKREVVNETCDA